MSQGPERTLLVLILSSPPRARDLQVDFHSSSQTLNKPPCVRTTKPRVKQETTQQSVGDQHQGNSPDLLYTLNGVPATTAF